ncbi:cadherin domain-containing protein [Chiayiivirga flava]|uniref:Cadherin domain-containing protein n=1 Tax=Chiayiivirga flava TaxID=659595 RepID=A0A7W8D6Z8_9GAMM|nr:cadherin domain-containing protein [Chiayiivirga flava]MBB5209069.1 hypothetical protein [Chiayiivirga flava]
MNIALRLAGVLLSLAGTHAAAQTVATEVYLDLDANPATGCSIATDAGTVAGAEVRVRAQVDAASATVQAVARAHCEGGVFGAEQPQPAGYAVGIDAGIDGADVIEFSTPLAGLGDGGTALASFVARGGDGGVERVQAAIVLPGTVEPGPGAAQPTVIPASGWLALLVLIGFTLWIVRRHPAFGSTFAVVVLMGSSIAWASNFIADGQIIDWTGVAPVATDPPDAGGDGASDILAAFAATESGRLHLRMDIRDANPEGADNQAPTLNDASFAIDENSAAGSVVGSIGATDPDADQTLAYAIVGGNTGDAFAIDADSGQITVANAAALDAELAASVLLLIEVTDDGEPALSASATATITVTDINEAPQLDDLALSVAEHAAPGVVVGTVVGTDPDTNAPNDALLYAITAGNTGNAFAIDADSGAIRVADSAQVDLANAPFVLTVRVTDGGTPPLDDSATVTIEVSDENDAPAFGQATYAFSVDENSAAGTPVGTVSASDPDAGDALTYTIAGGNTGNAFAIDAATGAIVVATASALDAETVTDISLVVTVSDDDAPARTDTATVNVTVIDLNEVPVLADASFNVAENSASGTVVGTLDASDPDATAPFATLVFAITAGNDAGTFAIDAGTGVLSVADAAALDFESGAAFALTVTATDGGGSSATAQVTIATTDVNEVPVLSDTARSVLQSSAVGTPVGAPVSASDPDTTAPNNTLTYAITGGNEDNAFTIDPASGQLAVASSAPLTAGAAFALVVGATDGGGLSDSATVTVDVIDVNDAPSFVAGPAQNVLEDAGPVSVPWATAIDDNDPGNQALTFLVSNDNAALFGTPPTISAGGVLSYAPAVDANGTATVTVVLQDDGGTANGGADTSAPQLFEITVAPVNDAPGFVAGGDQTVNEDAGAQSVAGWASAISPGPADEASQSVTFVASSDNPALFAVPVAVTPDGTLTYTPAADADGVATVSVQAMDDGGSANGGIDTSPPQTFTIGITADDDAPVAVADTATVSEDSAATAIDVLANDTDIDAGPIAIAAVTQPANGTVVPTGGTGLTYQPAANYCNAPPGTAPDTFTYTLTPGGSSATVSVLVTCVDDAPVAVADAVTVTEDSVATAIDVLANDTDVDAGPIAIASVTQPANGTVVPTGGTGLTYQPAANYCNAPPGTAPDTFTYTLTPGGSSTTVSVLVTCVDDAPVAVADTPFVAEDTPTVLGVLVNDTDVDGGPKTVATVTQPANGTAVITGGIWITYEPDPDYCNTPPGTAPDTFTYTVAPGGSSATVSVAVTCEDDAPVAVADAAVVAQDAAPTAIDVLANDTDVDGGPRSIASITQPANGTVAITGGGTGVNYTPDAGYCNTPPGTTQDTFTYALTPGGSSTTVSVAVMCPQEVVITSDGAGDMAELDFPGGGTIPVTDVDATAPIGNPPIVYSLAGGADQASFSIDPASGVLDFVAPPPLDPAGDADGNNVYEVTVRAASDTLEDTQQLSITIVQGLAVTAKYVVIMRSDETTNLDVRVLDVNGDVDPGAPYTIDYTSSAIDISATGQITVLTPGQSSTQVTISSPGRTPWVAWVAVRNVIDIASPHLSNQSIAASDDFSAVGSNIGTPTTSYYADIYRLTLAAGDEVEVTMDTGDDLDSYLLMANAQGFLVAGNDDDDSGALGVGSRMIYTATESGVYFIEASTFNGLDTGNYTLAVNVTPGVVDLGAYALNGSCGVLGSQGPGFTLTAGPTTPLPAGTTVLTTVTGVANSGVWSVTGGTASVAVVSPTVRQITLTAPLPAGQTIQLRTTLSITVAFSLAGSTTLPAGHVGTGGKPTGAVTSTLVLCSTS